MLIEGVSLTALPLYADVALPLPLRRTFTYRLPADFAGKVRVGARLVVPFGSRKITGYAVRLYDRIDPEQDIDDASIKNAVELIDEIPLVTQEIFELTKWTAEYYAASWGEVIKAALPAGLNVGSERFYTISAEGRAKLLESANHKPLSIQILQRLAEEGEASRRRLEGEFGQQRFGSAIRGIVDKGFVEVTEHRSANEVRPRLRKVVRLVPDSEPENGAKPLTDPQKSVLAALEAAGGELLFTELIDAAGVSGSAVTTLAKRGRIEVFVREIGRDPLDAIPHFDAGPLSLTREQNNAYDAIHSAIVAAEYKAFLLHGVTGSGKTEIYIRAMQRALAAGRSSLMLVPEIALTPVFSRRLRAAFGSEVAIIHSRLSKGERFDEWRRLRSGNARIAIGTRSAVFAPLTDVGLVVVDEEHDASYRQNESPFYNARDVAVMRARLANAVVVLGSATPSLESYFNSRSGKYDYLRLEKRIEGRPLAEAQLVDMREVFRLQGKDVLLSPPLIEAIRETHKRGEQSIILLNRRGYSAFVLCRTCGETLRCKNCDITLTYHRRDGKITCHYCGYSVATPRECPFCESEFLYFIGDGTERLEQVLEKTFPDLTIARIDRDTMNRKGQMAKTLFAFDRGEIDMLAGTQMIAKGHDFHNVTLVGVISIDTGLGLPDFRSAERTFQLLTQVAGRAGRGSKPGRVIIQTYYPEHYALQHAVRQDYEGFAAEELGFRERMSYPPYVALASILIRNSNEEVGRRNAVLARNGLEKANADRSCRILGPAPAAIARLKGEYRFQILLKSRNRKALRKILELGLDAAEAAGCDLRHVYSEIDPINLM